MKRSTRQKLEAELVAAHTKSEAILREVRQIRVELGYCRDKAAHFEALASARVSETDPAFGTCIG